MAQPDKAVVQWHVACRLPDQGRDRHVAELRRHPVSGEWVVICPEKNSTGDHEEGSQCIYCPGNEGLTGPEVYRVDGGGDSDSPGWCVRVVAESPPLFHIEGDFSKKAAGLCDCMEAIGAHEVVVESPAHDTEFESLAECQIASVLGALRTRAADLSGDERLRQVFMFKVRTTDMGCHPRWQVVSTPFVPGSIKEELKGSARYFSYKERCVFCDYIGQERKAGARIVCEEAHAVAISPYAARFPYEVWVLPKRHSPDFESVDTDEILGLAGILKRVTTAMLGLPESRGYVINLHTAPLRKPKPGAWETIDRDYHWHLNLRPRLDLLNGLKEGGGIHINPVSPESAAKTLRGLC
jgi:UDPglucose--hexose-1-phosphate uridylyltransferase